MLKFVSYLQTGCANRSQNDKIAGMHRKLKMANYSVFFLKVTLLKLF